MFLLGYYAEALTRHALIRRKLWGAATIFAGSGEAIEQARSLLSAIPELGLRPVGRLRSVDDLADMDRSDVEFVVTATKRDFVRIANAAKFAAFPPRVLLLQTEPQPAGTFLGPDTISLAVGRDINAPHNRLIKRAIDLAIGLPAMLVALPLIGVLAVLIKAFSPGPAFYAQARVGFNNRSFRVMKLRTMHCDAERLLERYLHSNEAARLEWERFCKLSRDPRVLPYIGNIIRRMSLDELPQLWQVVRGDISLIGPRPFPSYHTDLFDPEFQTLRSSVPAGLTGFWQVSSRSNGDIEAQKAQDLYYILNWSIWLDIYILLQTVPAVIGARGDRLAASDPQPWEARRETFLASAPPRSHRAGRKLRSLPEMAVTGQRPGQSEPRVIVGQAAFCAGRVAFAHFVARIGVVLEHLVSVCEAFRHIERAHIFSIEFDGDVLKVGWALRSQVDDDVEDGAARAAHDLGLGRWRELKMHPAERALP